jgi:hypothetical protein
LLEFRIGLSRQPKGDASEVDLLSFGPSRAKNSQWKNMRNIDAGVLNVAYLEAGPSDGTPVILLHGFPYDVHAYGAVSEILAAAGMRCIVPYLRGYGPTAFLSPDTPRSGQQAGLGVDLLALMDSLAIPNAVLAGFDWGGEPPASLLRSGRNGPKAW